MINLDGRTYSEHLKKAEAFNSYFHLVLKQPAHALVSDDYDLINAAFHVRLCQI